MFYDTSSTAGHHPRHPSLMAIAARPWHMLASLMLQRRTRTTLSNLSDHLLKDIGISRSDIPHVSRAAAPARFTWVGK